jgi:GT2 family glycosyltransferase
VDAAIVIPTFERCEVLLETLRCVARIDYPATHWEAIVVDDGSSLATIGVVREWIRASDAPVRLVQRPRQGPAAARNLGASLTPARVLIFIDNDILVKSNFIRRHLAILESHPGCWVIGRIVHPPRLRETPFGRYRDDCWEVFAARSRGAMVVETDGMTAANVSLLARDFERLGGFDEEFSIASCEDWELGQRARTAGIRILYDPLNVVVHNDWALDLRRFCERQRLYSISDVLLWRKYGERSPRAGLVRANGPIRWHEDSASRILKKVAKHLLATHIGKTTLQAMCAISERVRPDSLWSRRVYGLAVAVAIFSGVREGFRRYC